MYNALPHLRHKVVTNNHDAASVLKWAVFEMNRRYELLQANGARNLADFNRKVEEGKPLRHPSRPKPTLVTISAEAPDTPPEPPADENYTEGVLPYDRHRDRRAGRPHDDGAGRGGDAARDAGPEGPRHRHPSDPRDPAPVGERDHRPHQGELPQPDRVSGGVQGGQPHHPRPERRRGAARQRRHAVPAAGEERAACGSRARTSHRGHREGHGVVRGPPRGPPRRAADTGARRTTFWRSSAPRRAKGRAAAGDEAAGERDALFREAAEACIQNQGGSTSCCSAGCESATGGRRGSSTSSTTRGFLARRTGASRGKC